MDPTPDLAASQPAAPAQPLRTTVYQGACAEANGASPTATANPSLVSILPCEATLKQYRRGLVFLMRRECGNAALAEDLCNEAFRIAIALVQSNGLRKPNSLPAFLLQTARNLLLRIKQKEANHRTVTGEHEAIEEFADAGADVSVDVDVHIWARIIKEVMDELPQARDRKLLVRYYMEDQDKRKICRDLKISKGHFRRVTCRARQRFRQLLERRYQKSDLL